MFKIIIVCFLAGAGAGIGTGFAGMSAAAIIGPMLTTFLGINAYKAVGIGLASDVLASSVSAWTYKKSKNLDIKNSLVLLACVLVMTVFGSFIASLLPERAMSSTSQFFMILIGLRFLFKPVKNGQKQLEVLNSKTRIKRSMIGGLSVGFICGFVGAGGGMMLLFLLTTVLGYEMHMAVGTSVFIMAFTALIGGVSHFVIAGLPDLVALFFCVVFTFVWARIAAVLANKASEETLSRTVGVVMIVTSVVILLANYVF